MSRTIKGTRGPGWEPWSNRHQKAEQRANYREAPPDPWDEEICGGCPICLCVKCGGHMGAIDPDRWDTDVRCIDCGHEEHTNDVP